MQIGKYKVVQVYYPGMHRKNYTVKMKKKFLGVIPYWSWLHEEDHKERLKIFDTALEAHKYMETYEC